MQNSALIIIDMQKGMAEQPKATRNNHSAEKNILRLLAEWRNRALPVVHVRHISSSADSPFWPGQAGVEFQEQFIPLNGEEVVEKNIPDALANSGLEDWLKTYNISQIVITGVSTNNSVEATARTAGSRGFHVTVVSDGTFTFAMKDYYGVERTADEVHAMSLANLQMDYATIHSATEVLNAL